MFRPELDRPSGPDTVSKLEDLYVRCMSCSLPVEGCKGIKRVPEAGWHPRGFAFTSAPVELLVVAKNPGNPFEAEIRELAGLTGRDLFDAFRALQEQLAAQASPRDKRSLGFGKRLGRYLSTILDIPETSLGDIVASTNLVKCSFERKENDRLSIEAMTTCYGQYLSEEIALYRPRVLLALGREVESFLMSRRSEHGLDVLYVKHPSYPMSKVREPAILAELRERYLRAFDGQPPAG